MDRRLLTATSRATLLGVLLVLSALVVSCGSEASIPQATPTSVSTSTPASTTPTTDPPAQSTTTVSQPSAAELILGSMSLEQKAAQVMLVAFSGTARTSDIERWVTEQTPAGVLLLERNVQSAAQLKSLIDNLQSTAEVASGTGLIIAVDQEGGPVQRVHEGVPDLPSARSLGEDSTPEAAAALADETAEGLLSQGVNMNLAPVADVVGDDGSFLYSRAYGSDPATVSAFVAAVVEAYANAGLIAVVKHFPGHGSALGDTHGGPAVADIEQQTFSDVHLPPFRAAIASGVEGVMVSHVVASAYDPELPSSCSRSVIEGLLRATLGFKGVVVADDIEMAAAGSSFTDSSQVAVAALRAGCDLLISTGTRASQEAAVSAIVSAVQRGDLDPARLDEAVLRILVLKDGHGMIEPQGN